MDIKELEKKLDDFDKNVRVEALQELKKKVDAGDIKQSKNTNFVNLHCHTFYSFNAYGYSPQHIIWRGYKEGLEVVGTIDFDVLDCLEETLEAGEILGIKTCTGIETRVFFREYADKVITSPKEPGIYYFIATGFYKKPEAGSEAGRTLEKLKKVARDRNLKVLEKINTFLKEFIVDYEKDVLSLTPKENATERHIVTAIDRKSREVFGNNPDRTALFWAGKLDVNKEEVLSLLQKPADFQELIRMKLIKYGGVGYVLPEKKNFPTLEEVMDMAKETDGLPCAGWLDGTNEGEKDMESMLKLMIEKGAVLLNIIPDRSWNIKDKKEKEIRVKNLDEVMSIAKKLKLPVIAGTEMNKDGQKFVDDFEVPELKPYLEDFRKGAFFVYGHTQMGRLFNKGYHSEWAQKNFPSRIERTEFYIGKA